MRFKEDNREAAGRWGELDMALAARSMREPVEHKYE